MSMSATLTWESLPETLPDVATPPSCTGLCYTSCCPVQADVTLGLYSRLVECDVEVMWSFQGLAPNILWARVSLRCCLLAHCRGFSGGCGVLGRVQLWMEGMAEC